MGNCTVQSGTIDEGASKFKQFFKVFYSTNFWLIYYHLTIFFECNNDIRP